MSKNKALSVVLLFCIIFSYIGIVYGATPNPGHAFADIGGGAVQGDILYGSAADTIAALPKDTNATRYLSNTGTSNNPAWSLINMSNGATGTLAVANGGTSFASYTTGDILYASSSTTFAKLASVAAGSHLVSGGVGTAPSWSAVTFPNTAASSGKIIASDGTNWIASAYTVAAPGTSGNILTSDGTNWTSAVPTGTILGRQTLTSGTTYTPTTGTKNAIVEIWGAGGAGGSCTNTAGCAEPRTAG